MAKKPEFTNPFAEMFGDLAVDTTALNDVFKNTAAMGEKFSKMALSAVEKNVEISNKWTNETLVKLSAASKAQDEPADYSKVATDFVSASVEATSEHVAAFVEVAKKIQTDTVELLMTAGKEAQAEAAEVVKKATAEATGAVKKATAKAA